MGVEVVRAPGQQGGQEGGRGQQGVLALAINVLRVLAIVAVLITVLLLAVVARTMHTHGALDVRAVTMLDVRPARDVRVRRAVCGAVRRG